MSYHCLIENRHRRGYETATGENGSSGACPTHNTSPSKSHKRGDTKLQQRKNRKQNRQREPQKYITGYPERRCAGDTSLQQTKNKSDIRFWMSLCLLLTGHWYLPAGLCTVSQIEVSPLCSCTYSLICGYVAPFWNPDISIFSNENSTRTFFESISPLERRTTVSKKLVRSSPVGLGAI